MDLTVLLMKKLLKNTALFVIVLMAVAVSSCDKADWVLKSEIVGTWRASKTTQYGETEEITYSFTDDGEWRYKHIRKDSHGHTLSNEDWGIYSIVLGKISLESKRYISYISYDIEIKGNKLYLSDRDFSIVLIRD